MGHPVNVVFHDTRHSQVSPVVHCYYGGETLLRNLRRVVRDSHTFGASEMALALAIHWSLEYGQHTVALYNLDTPGLAEGDDEAESCRVRLQWVRSQLERDPEWVLVEIAEFRAVSKDGVWELDEAAPA